MLTRANGINPVLWLCLLSGCAVLDKIVPKAPLPPGTPGKVQGTSLSSTVATSDDDADAFAALICTTRNLKPNITMRTVKGASRRLDVECE